MKLFLSDFHLRWHGYVTPGPDRDCGGVKLNRERKRHVPRCAFLALPLPSRSVLALLFFLRQEEHVTGAVSSLAVTADFISPVMRCARNPHFLARAASARALAALVPPERSPILIGELLEKLPKDVAQAEAEGAGGHNHIHGEGGSSPYIVNAEIITRDRTNFWLTFPNFASCAPRVACWVSTRL